MGHNNTAPLDASSPLWGPNDAIPSWIRYHQYQCEIHTLIDNEPMTEGEATALAQMDGAVGDVISHSKTHSHTDGDHWRAKSYNPWQQLYAHHADVLCTTLGDSMLKGGE